MDGFTKDIIGNFSKKVTSQGKSIIIILEELEQDMWCMEILGKDNERFTWYESFTKPESAWLQARDIIDRGGIGKLYNGQHPAYMEKL